MVNIIILLWSTVRSLRGLWLILVVLIIKEDRKPSLIYEYTWIRINVVVLHHTPRIGHAVWFHSSPASTSHSWVRPKIWPSIHVQIWPVWCLYVHLDQDSVHPLDFIYHTPAPLCSLKHSWIPPFIEYGVQQQCPLFLLQQWDFCRSCSRKLGRMIPHITAQVICGRWISACCFQRRLFCPPIQVPRRLPCQPIHEPSTQILR